ncbi:MAG: ATP-binding protein [Clostridiales bacterium]|nr:ATP-binding protein [Clostridiales bacterium]MCF8022090.1 ATP-binding protein [Clostridiales bacterium]
MKKPVITVASGKGGTGKTTVASCLAISAGQPVQFLDCDVEEPNASIFLKPEFTSTKPVSLEVPDIDYNKCSFCGKCADICMYNALAVAGDQILTFPELCHSCGGCWVLCPEKAITPVPREIGIIESGPAQKNIEFWQGKLHVGAPTTPPVINAVKNEAVKEHLTILDAPPGTSCPVVETLEGTDFALLVTEPTLMGRNDLDLAVQLARKLNIPCGVIINRSEEQYDIIEKYCKENSVPVLMKIPQDREIARVYARGTAPVETVPHLKEDFKNMLEYIERVTVFERNSSN